MKQQFRCLPVAGACTVVLTAMSAAGRICFYNQPKMITQRRAQPFSPTGVRCGGRFTGTVARSERVEASYLTTGLD